MPSYWVPALAFALLQGLGIGLFSVFGFFLKPLAEAFQAKEAIIAMGLSLLVLVPALTGALLGRLVDGVAMRRLLMSGVWIAMVFLGLLPLAQHTWQLGLLFLGFVVGIMLYGPQATNVFLVRCYPQQQGRALALAAIGVSLAAVVLPPVTGWLIGQVGWQHSLQILAVALLLILSVAVRRGVPAEPAESASRISDQTTPVDFSDPKVRAALRHRAFWCVGIGFAGVQALMTVSSLCFVPHFVLQGLSLEAAGGLIALSGACGLVGKLWIAAQADRYRQHVRAMCMTLAVLQILGWSLLVVADGHAGMALAAVLVGFSGGASLPMFPFANAQYFAPATLGRINGVQMAFFLPFGLLAPPLAGYAFDSTGSYAPAFIGVAAVNGLLLLLFAALPPAGRGPTAEVLEASYS